MRVIENKAKRPFMALNNDYHFITHWRVSRQRMPGNVLRYLHLRLPLQLLLSPYC